MKKYEQLTQHQKDMAADQAVSVIVTKIVGGMIEFPFKDKLNREFVEFYVSVGGSHAYDKIMDNDDVVGELWELAENAAASAFFAEKGEYVINDVA